MNAHLKSLLILCCLLFAAALQAQDWPIPASTPNTPVNCSSACPGALAGKPTPGWSDPVVAFTGRFVDSAYEQDWQQTFRTARAGGVRTNPSGTRIYVTLGNAVAAYDAEKFFQRLEAREPLMSATGAPVNPPNIGTHPAPFEKYLNFDQFFYAEHTPSDWNTPPADGQDRLYNFDVDDRSVVYLAYSMFGWGTAKDAGEIGTTNLMLPTYQDPTSLDYSPRRIFWVKSSSGSYYVFVGKPSSPTLVYNVDDYLHPVSRGFVQGGFTDFARGNGRIAVIDETGTLLIYDNDTLISGGQPGTRAVISPSSGSYASVVFDGTNFWAAGYAGTAYSGVLSKFAPNTSGGYTRSDFALSGPNEQFQVQSMRYRDGYLGIGSFTSVGMDVRLVRISSGTPVDYPLNSVFYKYYSSPPTGYIRAPRSIPSMLCPWVRNGKLYVILPAGGLGDVWQLRNEDSLAVSVQGTAGGVNANAPARNPGDIFYGDKVAFMASTTGGATKPVQWNFGSPRPANDLGNSVAGTTGTVAYHQYVGLLPQDITAPLTVTATDTASGVAGSVPLQMKAPTVRFGVGNTISTYKYLFTQANASAPAPIVADDSFFDACDGDFSGHFDEWHIDSGAAQYGSPSTKIPVGTCGTHTLSLTSHYGAYTTMVPGNPDFAVGLGGTFTYSVLPFAVSIDYAADEAHDQLVFSSTSRSAAALANTAVTYKWDLVDQSGNVVLSQTSTTNAPSLSAVASWGVPRSTLTTAGMKARLVVSMADVSNVCAGASASQTAYSVALPGKPDAVLNVSNCTATGCTYSVTSPSGAMTRDNWTFLWTPSGAAIPANSTTSTYTPAFTNKGTYTVSVKVTNSVGSVTLTSQSYTTTQAASTCPNMVANSNVFLTGAGSNCRADLNTCTASDNVTFAVTFWQYPVNCATHTYSWTIDGANAGTAETVSRTFSAGSHTISCVLNNGSQSVTLQQTFTVLNNQPPPPPPPPVGGCGTLVPNSNVFASFSGPVSGCSDRGGTCSTQEAISFSIGFWGGYNQSCANHTFTWTFDGGSAQTGQSISKILAAGTHIVTCTVNNGSQSVPVSVTVNVAGVVQPPPVGNQCGTLTANQNVFLSYVGPVSNCHDSGNCSAGEAIAFTVAYWQFTPSTAAGCTPAYSWHFDDGGTGTGQSIAHTFNTTGQHTATCTITYGSQTLPLTATINVIGNPAIPPPEVTVAVDYLGANTFKFTPLVKSGTVTKFVWDFGDGTGATTTDAKPVTNTYLKTGKYTVTLTAQSNGPSTVVTSVVTVGSSRPRAVRH